jgi:diacylglycerol kinase (ATP)
VREAITIKSKIWIALISAVGALALAWLLGLSALAFALIVFISASVIAAEMFNTALEALEDIVSPEYREAVRRSKDLAAGAVLVLSLGAAGVGLLVFLPPIWAFLVY